MDIPLQERLVREVQLSRNLSLSLKACDVSQVKDALKQGAVPNFRLFEDGPDILDISDPLDVLCRHLPCAFWHARNIRHKEFVSTQQAKLV